VKLFKKKKSPFYWYDFTVGSRRYRGSTKEANKTRAANIAALKLSQAIEGKDPLPRGAPVLRDFAARFLEWLRDANLERKTKLYYQYGLQLLLATQMSGMRLNQISSDDIGALRFPGSPSNANCALRTLRRMLHKAQESKLIHSVPKFRLAKERERSLSLNEEAERALLDGAAGCKWRKRTLQLFKDVVVLMRDTGMRNERELYRVRIENVDWSSKVIFVPDSKTPSGRRIVPMSDRVIELLRLRCGQRREGWVFQSKRSKTGHLMTIGRYFREARRKAGLPESLVLYCGRHDYGTRILKHTGNLKAVMLTMGHKDVRTAMRYQHPEIEIVRQALNRHSGSDVPASA